MERRSFLKLAASLLPLPAFVKASSLWLPPEKPIITREVDEVGVWTFYRKGHPIMICTEEAWDAMMEDYAAAKAQGFERHG